MKRFSAFTFAVVLMFATLTPAFSQPATPTPGNAPDLPDGPYLPVYIHFIDDEPNENDEPGDRCYTSWSPPDLWWTSLPYQLVIEDESGRIINVTTVEARYTASEYSDEPTCIYDHIIELPEAEYYTVVLNDQRLITYTDETLPRDPARPFYFTIGDSPFR